MPPAELRARDDPGVLVEPVADVVAAHRAVRREPLVEPAGPGSERDLVERLRLRARADECRRPRTLRLRLWLRLRLRLCSRLRLCGRLRLRLGLSLRLR